MDLTDELNHYYDRVRLKRLAEALFRIASEREAGRDDQESARTVENCVGQLLACTGDGSYARLKPGLVAHLIETADWRQGVIRIAGEARRTIIRKCMAATPANTVGH